MPGASVILLGGWREQGYLTSAEVISAWAPPYPPLEYSSVSASGVVATGEPFIPMTAQRIPRNGYFLSLRFSDTGQYPGIK